MKVLDWNFKNLPVITPENTVVIVSNAYNAQSGPYGLNDVKGWVLGVGGGELEVGGRFFVWRGGGGVYGWGSTFTLHVFYHYMASV